MSSQKSMVGHLIGASGAVEAAATALSLERGVIPPTINQAHARPDCDLDYVPNTAREMPGPRRDLQQLRLRRPERQPGDVPGLTNPPIPRVLTSVDRRTTVREEGD